ncbi:MAG TPA: LacI family DNA-binding transcriptional regulator, partial [Pilimelia sp.]|nr:LacI family DNA-binding transcriptional regulator [Pilimelia sp.]
MSQRVPSGRQPTLDDVAARAGVGRGTVSRVVNGSPKVSAQVRAAVERAVVELGYVPNRAARALVTRRTDVLALVVLDPPGEASDAAFAAVVRGALAGLDGTDWQTWLLLAASPRQRERAAAVLTRQHVDGVLLIGAGPADPLAAALERRQLPAVFVGGYRPATPGAGWADVEDQAGGRRAAEHLLAAGRRWLGAVAGDSAVEAAALTGYRSALRAGPPGSTAAGVQRTMAADDCAATVHRAAAAVRRLCQQQPRLDGVFATSDLAAVGAVRALGALGRRVPADVAVVGYGDTPVATGAQPPLTTVRRPAYELGRCAATLLLGLLGAVPSGAEPAGPPAQAAG